MLFYTHHPANQPGFLGVAILEIPETLASMAWEDHLLPEIS
jgi:hypothetical protein